jgi:hypothetical protein
MEETFKGTVSRDGFGFLGHAWSVLGFNMGRGQFLNFLGAQMLLWRLMRV